jgi:hypothetical protein
MSLNEYDLVWQPTPEQKLLLRAAGFEGRVALDAWQQWKSSIDIEHLDSTSYRILPQLYRNLQSQQAASDPLMSRLKSVYRHTWSKNQIFLHAVSRILRAFHDEGIPVMVLKGMALVPLYYKDWGVRPMSDIDMMVPTTEAERAMRLLAALGWQSKSKHPERFLHVRHSTDFINAAGQSLDLHWHLLWECCQAGADDDFWEAAIPVQIGEVTAQALCPADQLLHVCIHGSTWNPNPPFRWAADAAVIIRSAGDRLNWQRLYEQAEKRRLVLPLSRMLGYLHDGLDVPVPEAFLQRLRTAPVSKAEQREYRLKTRPMRGLPSLQVFWYNYTRSAGSRGVARHRISFPRYLQYNWNLEHLHQVPVYMVTRVARRNLRRIGAFFSRKA